jgi:hypothetical protein
MVAVGSLLLMTAGCAPAERPAQVAPQTEAQDGGRIDIEGGYAVIESGPRASAAHADAAPSRVSATPERLPTPTPRGVAPDDPEPGQWAYVHPFGPRGPAPAMRMGRATDGEGRVPDSEQTDVFMTYDSIHLSIRAPAVPAGSPAYISIVRQGSAETVWHDQRVVSSGETYLAFGLGPRVLPPGSYVARLTVDGGPSAVHGFRVGS